MTTRVGKALDFVQTEALNFVFQNLAAAPSSPKPGQAYLDTVTGRLKIQGASAFYDPADRASHVGTQPASTISDFDTQVRTSRLDQLAKPTAVVDINGQRLINGAAGTASSDFIIKSQLDTVKAALDQAISGLDIKGSVHALSTTNVNLSAPGTALDGQNYTTNRRYGFVGQTNPVQNGIYVWNGAALVRAADADTGTLTSGAIFSVEEGTANKGSAWRLETPDPITVGTTPQTWTQFAKPFTPVAGAGIGVSGSTITADVRTVFGRIGNVVATLNDYAASLIGNDSSVSGATVKDALQTLASSIATLTTNVASTYVAKTTTITAGAGLSGGGDLSANRTLAANVVSVLGRTGAVVATLNDYAASLISNDSGVTGTTVKAALDTLNTAIGAANTSLANYVLKTTTITAGAGLTGGGDLSANRTLTADVVSVLGRTGAVVAAQDDYTTAQIRNSGVAAAYPGLPTLDAILQNFATSIASKASALRSIVAGTGLTGGGDLTASRTLSIDTAVVVRKYVETLATSSTSYVITHNLNTLDVGVSVYLVATGEEVIADVLRTSANTVTVGFAVAAAAGTYRVVVHG